MKNQYWLPTKAAADALGISTDSLKRYRETAGGFLEGGTHYIVGPSINSPITWSVEAIRQAFHARGMRARRELAAGGRHS